MSALEEARELLSEKTPLKTDCGRVCGGLCCRSMEGEETGMLLFPGEEAFYENMSGWRMVPAGQETLLICPGECDRKVRPLSCRIFPMIPVILEDGTVAVRTDERARTVCPLTKQGKQGMDPAFIRAVQQAGEKLALEIAQRAFLLKRAREQEELRALRKAFMDGR